MDELPKSMKAVLLKGHGGPDKLVYCDDIAIPTPADHEVLIRVLAAGVNNTDINTRTGWYSKKNNSADDAGWMGKALGLPRIQGADVCGNIVATGRFVDSKRIGERVLVEPCLREIRGETVDPPWYLGSECDGGFAEYVCVSAKHAYQINSPLTDVELASFPCSYSTAENLLTRACVTKDERVLISGASGGVGSAAVQLAKARGARVIAITSQRKNEQILALGAEMVLDREADMVDLLGQNSVDVVIDLVAGKKWADFLTVLRPKGRYAVSGAIGGALVELDIRTLYLKDLNFFGCTQLEPEVFGNLIRYIEQGKITPLIAKIYPLSCIHQAQAAFLEKTHVGKIVLRL
jgi:NADPH:quinone reductase-like Zn-dependent oxidoreductase